MLRQDTARGKDETRVRMMYPRGLYFDKGAEAATSAICDRVVWIWSLSSPAGYLLGRRRRGSMERRGYWTKSVDISGGTDVSQD